MVEPRQGVLPDGELKELFEKGSIRADRPLDADQIQPASLDLRLGTVAYRILAFCNIRPAFFSINTGRWSVLTMRSTLERGNDEKEL